METRWILHFPVFPRGLAGTLVLFTLFLFSAQGSRADAVSDWNATANTVMLRSGRPGGAIIVDMAYVHVAIYDAVNAIDRRYTPFAVVPQGPPPWASKEAATAAAAYGVLLDFYPAQKPYLDSVYDAYLHALPNTIGRLYGVAAGENVASAWLALRAADGRNAAVAYTFGSGPGVYQLTPGAPAPPATPQTPWIARMKPFTMLSDSQFRVPPPPELSSELYGRDLNETLRFGARDNSLRTAAMTEIGMFYADNPANQLSRNIRLLAASSGMGLADNARLFAQAYVTIGDGVIATWDSKFRYNRWRPVTAIRAADTDGNASTEPDTAWLPLVVTPGHPEYPAAHGAVTGGYAYALERFFGGASIASVLTSATVPGVAMAEHAFTNTNDIVTEVINARVYGGMHFRTSVERGAAMARQVADWVADHFFRPRSESIPVADLQLWLRADSGLVLNGLNVSRWKDVSGNGNDALQRDTARQPFLLGNAVNGRPALRFDGVNDRLGFTGTTRMSQFSIFIVQKIDSGAADAHYYYPISLGDSTGGYGLSMRNGFSNNSPDEIDPYVDENSWVRAVTPGCSAFGQWKSVCVIANKSMWNTTMLVNGVAAAITPQGTVDAALSVPLGNATGSAHGALGMTDGFPLAYLIARCQVAEVLVYGSALSDSARKAVEQYLALKYNIVAPLGTTAVSQKESATVTGGFALEQNYPNPFNPETRIGFRVGAYGPVKLAVYDMLGREVAVLVNEPKAPGEYAVRFGGPRLASGLYLYRLEAGGVRETRRMLLLK